MERECLEHVDRMEIYLVIANIRNVWRLERQLQRRKFAQMNATAGHQGVE
jgi:hypothetical protein